MKQAGGYFTVEAALILPLVLALYVVLIYSSFFLYDRCIAAQDAYILCMREGTRKDPGTGSVPDPQRILADEARQRGTKYIAAAGWKSGAYAEGGRAVYSAEGTCRPPVLQQVFLLGQDMWTFRVRAAARKSDPPLLIRKVRRREFIVKEALELLSNQSE